MRHLRARWQKYDLHFKRPSKTSRETLLEKPTYFIDILDIESGLHGIGEAALFRGLSADDTPQFEALLEYCCANISYIDVARIPSSAIRAALETALSDLANGGTMRPFDASDDFSIPINGLVWMGSKDFMLREVAEKIEKGFRCVKLKIGGIDFEDELSILKSLRARFSADRLEIRLDANGAFTPDNALSRLDRLARFDIHSIEQPIRQGQIASMARICRESAIPIALDEELIGYTPTPMKEYLLSEIKPRYIILKPSLCGGFVQADSWIACAERLGIGWWATSALESNIGLNAIARWVSSKHTSMPQGLGTGLLYTNNIASPLQLVGDRLCCRTDSGWNLKTIGLCD